MVRRKPGSGDLDPKHPNALGYISMYRALDFSLFEQYSCNSAYSSLKAESTYMAPKAAANETGQCRLSNGSTPAAQTVFQGDAPGQSVWTAHAEACRAYCTSVSCSAYEFMSDPTLDVTAGSRAHVDTPRLTSWPALLAGLSSRPVPPASFHSFRHKAAPLPGVRRWPLNYADRRRRELRLLRADAGAAADAGCGFAVVARGSLVRLGQLRAPDDDDDHHHHHHYHHDAHPL